jgi:predicted XRE-type DNA-binding protein
MKTVTVELINEYALQLLQDLEKAEVIRLVDVAVNKPSISRKFRGKISKQTADDLHNQLNTMRDEWQNNI